MITPNVSGWHAESVSSGPADEMPHATLFFPNADHGQRIDPCRVDISRGHRHSDSGVGIPDHDPGSGLPQSAVPWAEHSEGIAQRVGISGDGLLGGAPSRENHRQDPGSHYSDSDRPPNPPERQNITDSRETSVDSTHIYNTVTGHGSHASCGLPEHHLPSESQTRSPRRCPPRCVISGSVSNYTHGVGVYNTVIGRGSLREKQPRRHSPRPPTPAAGDDDDDVPVMLATSGPLEAPAVFDISLLLGSEESAEACWEDAPEGELTIPPRDGVEPPVRGDVGQFGQTSGESGGPGSADVSEETETEANEVSPVPGLDIEAPGEPGEVSSEPPDGDARGNAGIDDGIDSGHRGMVSTPARPETQQSQPIVGNDPPDTGGLRGGGHASRDASSGMVKRPKFLDIWRHSKCRKHTAPVRQRNRLRKRRRNNADAKQRASLSTARPNTDEHHGDPRPTGLFRILSPAKPSGSEKHHIAVQDIGQPIPMPASPGFTVFDGEAACHIATISTPFEHPREAPAPAAPAESHNAEPENARGTVEGPADDIRLNRENPVSSDPNEDIALSGDTSGAADASRGPANQETDGDNSLLFGTPSDMVGGTAPSNDVADGTPPVRDFSEEAGHRQGTGSGSAQTAISAAVVHVIPEDIRSDSPPLASADPSHIWRSRHPNTSQESVPSLTSYPHPRPPTDDAGPEGIPVEPMGDSLPTSNDSAQPDQPSDHQPADQTEQYRQPPISIEDPNPPTNPSTHPYTLSSSTCCSVPRNHRSPVPTNDPPKRLSLSSILNRQQQQQQLGINAGGRLLARMLRADSPAPPIVLRGSDIGYGYRNYLPEKHRQKMRREVRRREQGRRETEGLDRGMECVERDEERDEEGEGMVGQEQEQQPQRRGGHEPENEMVVIRRGEVVIHRCWHCGAENDVGEVVERVVQGIGVAMGGGENEMEDAVVVEGQREAGR